MQGTYESSNFSEELFSNELAERSIKVSEGNSIVSIPLKKDEVMYIGCILNKNKELSELGEIYVEALK